MNEIERAIAEIVGSNYGECQCHRETMMLAVEALKEKQERDKEIERLISEREQALHRMKGANNK